MSRAFHIGFLSMRVRSRTRQIEDIGILVTSRSACCHPHDMKWPLLTLSAPVSPIDHCDCFRAELLHGCAIVFSTSSHHTNNLLFKYMHIFSFNISREENQGFETRTSRPLGPGALPFELSWFN